MKGEENKWGPVLSQEEAGNEQKEQTIKSKQETKKLIQSGHDRNVFL